MNFALDFAYDRYEDQTESNTDLFIIGCIVD